MRRDQSKTETALVGMKEELKKRRRAQMVSEAGGLIGGVRNGKMLVEIITFVRVWICFSGNFHEV